MGGAAPAVPHIPLEEGLTVLSRSPWEFPKMWLLALEFWLKQNKNLPSVHLAPPSGADVFKTVLWARTRTPASHLGLWEHQRHLPVHCGHCQVLFACEWQKTQP